ncbi:WD repeat-containing protein [Klebsormidium nitens]|uniref:WD repeat-containing protein n=1 Tax=Klebsormidium nitens TaxID=105231 RepID=A0A1Y1HQZ8_KLENI|nr:WD repeat-containing protein [Klebsormidium nitens]|eukprot:GAQ79609.1 WD repeat-containing protein [Klebsormidium nitens]
MPIFQPYRALGYITESTPFSVQKRGQDVYVTVSIGKAWQIYKCGKLQLTFVGPPLEKNIRALASRRDVTFAAYGRKIGVFNRAHQVATWEGHTGKIVQLLVLGSHLLSIGDDRKLLLWPLGRPDVTEPEAEIELEDGFQPTTIMHPDTYLNKVLIGSEDGRLQLWNISSRQMVFQFDGWKSPVRCAVPSPALDVVGVGLADGRVIVHNLKFNETVMTLTHTFGGPVNALSFRTDGRPLLAAGNGNGMVTVWDLEKKQLSTVIKDAHDGPVTALYFFPSEPVLMSAGADNSLKMWIFDQEDGAARLLRFRSGHSAPPCAIQYYASGRHILSAGNDRAFRLFSTIQDQQSRELSQGHLAKRAKRLKLREEELKLARVTGFAVSEVRARDWCNVVTCHEGDPQAYTWRLQNYVIGEHVLRAPGGTPSPVRAASISACGNFAVIGTANGRIDRFNLQSGIHRGGYSEKKAQFSPAHEGAVVGVECDGSNKILVSGGYDGRIKVWNFKTRKLIASWPVGSPLVQITFHRGNGLIAAASDDLTIRVYDAAAHRLVRKFPGHADRITGMCFSEDGRWLLSAGMDATLRVWDVVAAQLLDAMKLDVPITALSLSPGMDMLATTHANRNGIYLWANRLLYLGTTEGQALSSSEPRQVRLPLVSADPSEEPDQNGTGREERDGTAGAGPSDRQQPPTLFQDAPHITNEGERRDLPGETSGRGPVQQLTPELITLAMLPRAQWQGLVNLDVIKERNKPIEPPKKPEKAPFFLPTLPSVSGVPQFIAAEKETEGAEPSTGKKRAPSRVLKHSSDDDYRSEFVRRLHEGAESGDYSPLVALLREMAPSAVDSELRAMEIVNLDADVSEQEDDVRDVGALLDFIAHELAAKRNFELIQALLNLALKVHGDAIISIPQLQAKAALILQLQSESWGKLDQLFQNVRCMVGFVANTQQ